MPRQFLMLAFTLLIAASDGWAQLGANPALTPSAESMRGLAAPQPADWTLALARLDRELAARAPAPEESVRGLNRAVDNAMIGAAGGNLPAAIGAVDRESASLRAGTDLLPQHVISMSLQVRVDPPVWRVGSPEPTLRAAPLYVVRFNQENYAEPRIVIALKSPDGAVVAEREFVFGEATEWPQSAPLFGGSPPTGLSPGVYTLTARWAEGKPREFEVGRWQVATASFNDAQASNRVRLDRVAETSPALAGAVAVVRSRNDLLTDAPSPEHPAQWTADLGGLARELEQEIGALESGRDPFVGRVGDWWFLAELGGVKAPTRVLVPEGLGDGEAPLLIALHGGGADENSILDACGAGELGRLAGARGLVVVSPRADAMAYPASLDALVHQLAAWRPIDRSRVFIVGHASGAALASSLARARPDAVAAVALVSGAPSIARDREGPFPRVLFVSGTDDTQLLMSRVRTVVDAAQASGVDAETLEVGGAGHTLALRSALPQIVDWLLPSE